MNFIIQFIRWVFKLLEAKPSPLLCLGQYGSQGEVTSLYSLFREVHFLYHRFHCVSRGKILTWIPAQWWRLARKSNEELNGIISLSF